jgi:Arc/MetJ family transcription regulator
MSATEATNPKRQRTTLPLNRELLADAQRELGTATITETVETALRLVVRRRPRALFDSGRSDLASNTDAYLSKGFGK